MKNLLSSVWVRTLACAAGCVMAVSSAAAQDLEKLTVRLDWTPWATHSAFHLAQQKGWYKEAGLDVNFEDGNGSVTTVQIVGSSNNFDVGHAALASMMIARDKGLPVKAVAPFVRKSDIGVLVPTDSNIKGPADLKGKKVVYTAGSLEAPFIDPFLEEGGVKRSDVELINVEAAAKATTYSVGRADAVVSTIPFILGTVSETRPSRAIPFADYGLQMPSFGIFASEEKLKDRRDAIEKFASVTSRTWQYIYDGHQDEAVKAIIAARPQARLSEKVLRDQLDNLYAFFGEPAKGERIGIPVPSDWEQGVQTLKRVELIKGDAPATDYYVADLVHPEKYDSMVGE